MSMHTIFFFLFFFSFFPFFFFETKAKVSYPFGLTKNLANL